VTNPAVVAAPTFSPVPGVYATAQTVTISSATPDAQIFYTTNGNTPRFDVPNSFTKTYTGPITLASSATIKAVARKTGFLNLVTAVANYTIGAGRMALEDGNSKYFFESAEIEEIDLKIDISLIPNPSQGRFQILSKNASEEAYINIVNMLGQTIWEGKMEQGQTQMEIDITRQPTGIYSVRYQSPSLKKEIRVTKL
jgi:hypothetical protein